MEISIENAGPYNSVRLYGQLDSRGAGSIYDTIVGLGSLGPGKVIVNVGSVTHATRAGCGALIVAAKMLHSKTGEKLIIYDASPEFVSIFDGSGYNHLIEVHPSCQTQIPFAAPARNRILPDRRTRDTAATRLALSVSARAAGQKLSF